MISINKKQVIFILCITNLIFNEFVLVGPILKKLSIFFVVKNPHSHFSGNKSISFSSDFEIELYTSAWMLMLQKRQRFEIEIKMAEILVVIPFQK